MLNTKTKFDTFQILGKEDAAGKVVTMRKY